MEILNTAVESVDADLERRIRIFLAQKNVSALQRIAVSASKGTVRVRGRVHSFYEKQLCLNCCQHVAGVIRVIDEIEVEAATSKRPR
jgi:osmotically-inducible protein OsmY